MRSDDACHQGTLAPTATLTEWIVGHSEEALISRIRTDKSAGNRSIVELYQPTFRVGIPRQVE